MNRSWSWLNLLGVLVLAGLCVLQWGRDRALNLDLNRNEKVRLSQQARIAEQDKDLLGLRDDLATFKEQLVRSQGELGEARKRVQELERNQRQLVSERDQLKESVTNWANAVAVRDERLVTANSRIHELTDQLNDSIQKFNVLATNYNTAVQTLNELRAASAASAANRTAR